MRQVTQCEGRMQDLVARCRLGTGVKKIILFRYIAAVTAVTALIHPVQLAGGGGGEVQVPHQGRGAAVTAGQERSETRTVISFIINQIEQVCQKVYIC